jgi:hypothetical protein
MMDQQEAIKQGRNLLQLYLLKFISNKTDKSSLITWDWVDQCLEICKSKRKELHHKQVQTETLST